MQPAPGSRAPFSAFPSHFTSHSTAGALLWCPCPMLSAGTHCFCTFQMFKEITYLQNWRRAAEERISASTMTITLDGASLNPQKWSHPPGSDQLSVQEADTYSNNNRCMCNSPPVPFRGTVHKLRMTPVNTLAHRIMNQKVMALQWKMDVWGAHWSHWLCTFLLIPHQSTLTDICLVFARQGKLKVGSSKNSFSQESHKTLQCEVFSIVTGYSFS